MFPEEIARLLRAFGEAEAKGMHELAKTYFERAIQEAARRGLLKELAQHVGKDVIMKIAPQVAKQLGLDAAGEALFTGVAATGGATGASEAILFGLTAPELALVAGVVVIGILLFAAVWAVGSYFGHILQQRAAWQKPGTSLLRDKMTVAAGKVEPSWRHLQPGRVG